MFKKFKFLAHLYVLPSSDARVNHCNLLPYLRRHYIGSKHGLNYAIRGTNNWEVINSNII